MRRRNWTRKERIAAYLASGGTSDLSGKPLDDGFHVDHVIPFSRGGETELTNAQALTPEENLLKSNTMPAIVLREWQERFLAMWDSHQHVDFLLSALPGAGKTIASLNACKAFLNDNPGGKLIVVVPTVTLKEQWRDDAWKLFGLALQTSEFSGSLKGDHCGAVTTYQSVAGNAKLFNMIVHRQPTMVVMDEIHHAGDERQWGDAIKFAFSSAKKRLALSGTPFRHDNQRIPFVAYDVEGYSVSDCSYDYPDAIKDGVVRIISFHHHAGRVEYLKDGEECQARIDQGVSEDESKAHLGKLLSAGGNWVRTLIVKANERLDGLRKHKADAGGLILCMDSQHAMLVADVLESITGDTPAIILSDDELANSSVKEFRDSSRKWVVAVRKVSEGVDIKRLMVLCYLTNAVTTLFFRQAIGRIVRNQNTEFDEEAYCYLPDDPRLIRMAKDIEKAQVSALQEGDEEYEKQEREGREVKPSTIMILGTSAAEARGIIIDGKAYSVADAITIRDLASRVGISEAKAAAAMSILLGAGHSKTPSTPAENTEQHPEDVASGIRKKLKSRVNVLSKLTGRDHGNIHTEYMASACSTKQNAMTVAQLREKLQWIERKIAMAR